MPEASICAPMATSKPPTCGAGAGVIATSTVELSEAQRDSNEGCESI